MKEVSFQGELGDSWKSFMADAIVWQGVPDRRTRIGERAVTVNFAFEVWGVEEASATAGAQSSGRRVQLEKIGQIGRDGQVMALKQTGILVGDAKFDWEPVELFENGSDVCMFWGILHVFVCVCVCI